MTDKSVLIAVNYIGFIISWTVVWLKIWLWAILCLWVLQTILAPSVTADGNFCINIEMEAKKSSEI